jgi:hypothetical protein
MPLSVGRSFPVFVPSRQYRQWATKQTQIKVSMASRKWIPSLRNPQRNTSFHHIGTVSSSAEN